jgi:hypothetical protein
MVGFAERPGRPPRRTAVPAGRRVYQRSGAAPPGGLAPHRRQPVGDPPGRMRSVDDFGYAVTSTYDGQPARGRPQHERSRGREHPYRRRSIARSPGISPRDGTVLVFHTGTPCGLVPLPAALDPAPMGIRTLLYARPGYGRGGSVAPEEPRRSTESPDLDVTASSPLGSRRCPRISGGSAACLNAQLCRSLWSGIARVTDNDSAPGPSAVGLRGCCLN